MIEEILNKQIEKEQADRTNRVRSGKWNPSSFGQCFLRQWYNRKDKKKTNPPNMKAFRLFRIGNLIHRDIQNLLDEDACEVEVDTEDVHGFSDYVTDNAVYDFKTVGHWKWTIINKKFFDPHEELIDYILQLMSYCYFLNKTEGFLILICKDTYEMRTLISMALLLC